MCKCLGCMEGVVLLSELHPHAWNLFNPLKQTEEWFGLLTQNNITDLQNQGPVNYTTAIALIEQRCRTRGDTLVLRDWAHLDYTGFPFVTAPGYRPLLYTELFGQPTSILDRSAVLRRRAIFGARDFSGRESWARRL